jgi:hypothetical protein
VRTKRNKVSMDEISNDEEEDEDKDKSASRLQKEDLKQEKDSDFEEMEEESDEDFDSEEEKSEEFNSSPELNTKKYYTQTDQEINYLFPMIQWTDEESESDEDEPNRVQEYELPAYNSEDIEDQDSNEDEDKYVFQKRNWENFFNEFSASNSENIEEDEEESDGL